MMREIDDDVYRRKVITKEGKEIDIVEIGNILLFRDSIGSKFYKLIKEDLDEDILSALEGE